MENSRQTGATGSSINQIPAGANVNRIRGARLRARWHIESAVQDKTEHPDLVKCRTGFAPTDYPGSGRKPRDPAACGTSGITCQQWYKRNTGGATEHQEAVEVLDPLRLSIATRNIRRYQAEHQEDQRKRRISDRRKCRNIR
jgi:hypothetical protein